MDDFQKIPDFSKDADGGLSVILSVAGPELSEEERTFFQCSNPLGFILFARNCETPKQLKALTDSLKDTVDRDCPILIDQEGGRVQRLKPPVWRQYPPMKSFGDAYAQDSEKALADLRYSMMQLGEELSEGGITVNCAPVLDVLNDCTHDAIGDRAFSSDPHSVGRLGACVCRTFLSLGIVPVIKHIPGHGRAQSDSHKDLPAIRTDKRTLGDIDFESFRSVCKSDVGKSVWGMVAHLLFEDIDAAIPSSLSPMMIENIIRGDIGFDGFLVSDDVDMKALDHYGSVAERCKKTIDAGCDAALYCWADLKTMHNIVKTVPKLSDSALLRLKRAAELPTLSV